MTVQIQGESKPVNRRVIIERICPGLAIVHFEPPMRLEIIPSPSSECLSDDNEEDSEKIAVSQKQDEPKPHSIIDHPDVGDLQLEATLAGLIENDDTFTLTAEGRALFENSEKE